MGLLLIVGFCGLLKRWEELVWRHRLVAIFSLFSLGLLGAFQGLGWLELYDEDSQRFEIIYATLNLHVFYLQYLHSPVPAPPPGKESYGEVEGSSSVESGRETEWAEGSVTVELE
jgi:hypothetical protein